MEDNFMNDDPWNVNDISSKGSVQNETSRNSYFSAEDLGKISMACGIMAFFWYKGLFSILGLLFGFTSLAKGRNSSATIGIVCSIINLVIIAIAMVGIAVLIFAFIPAASDLYARIKDALSRLYGF